MAALGMERRGHGTAPDPSTPGSHGQGALPALGVTFRQGSGAGPAGTAPQHLPSLWFSKLEKPPRSQTPPAALLWADTSRRHPGKGKHPEKTSWQAASTPCSLLPPLFPICSTPASSPSVAASAAQLFLEQQRLPLPSLQCSKHQGVNCVLQ